VHEQQRVVLAGLVGDDAEPHPARVTGLLCPPAVAERDLVADLTQAGHLGAVLAGEGDAHPAAEGHGLACFHEESRRRDVPGNAAREAVRRTDVDGEDLVEAQVAAAIAHGRAPSERMRRPGEYAVVRCSQNIYLRRSFLLVRSAVTLLA